MSKTMGWSERKAEIKKLNYAIDILEVLRQINTATKLEIAKYYPEGGEQQVRHGLEYLLNRGIIYVSDVTEIPRTRTYKGTEIKLFAVKGCVYKQSTALFDRLEILQEEDRQRTHRKGRGHLTGIEKQQIVETYSNGPKITYKQLAKSYGVSVSRIGQVLTEYRKWKGV